MFAPLEFLYSTACEVVVIFISVYKGSGHTFKGIFTSKEGAALAWYSLTTLL